MTIRLENTDARQINETLLRLRKEGQTPSGQVLTLVVNTPAQDAQRAMTEALDAAALLADAECDPRAQQRGGPER